MSNWISVNDQLPGHDVDVIIYPPNDDGQIMGSYDHNKNCWRVLTYIAYEGFLRVGSTCGKSLATIRKTTSTRL